MTGCWHNPPKPSNVSLNRALQDIRTSLDNFRPTGEETPLGIWLTDVEVTLKVDASEEKTRGLEVVPATGKLVGTTLTISNVDTNSTSNTVTLKFKNPFVLGKDTLASTQLTPAGKDGKPAPPADGTPPIVWYSVRPGATFYPQLAK